MRGAARDYSPDLFVTKDTPPTFIYHTFNDQTVPVEQSLRFYDALVKAGVPSELHVFAQRRARQRTGQRRPALDQWPTLLENWLRARGCCSGSRKPDMAMALWAVTVVRWLGDRAVTAAGKIAER